MIDYDILDKDFETSNARLRQICTNHDAATPDGKVHKKLSKILGERIQEGVNWSLQQAHFYAAADLMWDGVPILPENIPLIQYAQGRIKESVAITQLEKLNCADNFIETKKCQVDGKEQEVKSLNYQKFVEVCVGLGRSYLSRRLFAQQNKYDSQYPWLPYESRHRNSVGKLRAEAMGEYAQIMVDSYGYKDVQEQFTRDMLMYTTVPVFPECAWDEESQVRYSSEKEKNITKIVREGVPMTVVHPSCWFYDRTYAPRTLNTDTGCEWTGHWDIRKFGEIHLDDKLWNKDRIKYSAALGKTYQGFANYLDMVFASDPISIAPPKARAGLGDVPLATANDRSAMSSFYAQNDHDTSVFLTDIRMKLVPRKWGLGKYPHPVWIRFLVGSDDTILFAEILPSRPCFTVSFNAKDSRLLNQSQMHEMMPWQDQLSNLISQSIMVMKHSLLRIILLNTEVLDDDTIEKIKADLTSDTYYVSPHLLPYSAQRFDELGIDIRTGIVTIVSDTRQLDEYLNNSFKAMANMLGLMERLMMLSPQEQGQPAPREITATESAMLEATTTAVYASISSAIEKGRSAWKRIIYESAQAKASNTIFLPVAQTYTRETIEKAGFEVVDEEEFDKNTAVSRHRTFSITGTKDKLEHDYLFTSRDANDRPTNSQHANTLISLLGQVLPMIGPEAIGKERIFEIINEIFRLTGAYSLKLETAEGENEAINPETQDMVKQLVEQLVPMMQQIATTQAENKQGIQELGDLLVQIANQLSPEEQQPPQT